MPVSNLRQWLIQHPGFQQRCDAVIRSAVAKEFPQVALSQECGDHDWRYLLLCASALARSDKTDEQRLALRIADTCLQLDDTTPEERAAAAVILDTMANRRTISLATERRLVSAEFEEALPLPLRADLFRREDEDTIITADGARFAGNRFQAEFWRACKEVEWVSASAPTSAGKSFLLRAWVRDLFKTRPTARVAFVVPTRALIQEVADAFGDDQKTGLLPNVVLHTLPLEPEFGSKSGHLFVFTQERLHILLGRQNALTFDAIIVDEAHKVGDGHRGVLLEQVVHECVRRSASTKVIFAAPHAENPGYLLQDAPPGVSTRPVDREVSTVSQNLLFASQKPGNPIVWNIDYRDGEKTLPIGAVHLTFRPTSDSKRLSAVAFALRCESGNLVYANGQADAEKFALQIADAYVEAGGGSLETHPRIVELVKLVQKTVHRQYRLIEALKQGVAFHYGNMPLLVRLEIEALFRLNILRFLVCTSTLMEGVNLPCKVIFMRGPKKGRGDDAHLTPSDFWNLAGRAGRWGTEFQGSIFCIDPLKPKVWPIAPPLRRIRQTIKGTTDATLSDADGLLKYVDDGFPIQDALKRPEYDYAASFLLSVLARGETLESVPAAARLSQQNRDRLAAALGREIEAFDLPRELIFRNPGVLPRAMMELRTHFRGLTADEFAQHIPVLPESDDANERYFKILTFINERLRGNLAAAGAGETKRLWQLAYLTVDWMRGRPLSLLIRTRERISARNNDIAAKLPAIIRGVMADVEEYARFKIPRFLRCYLGVLTEHAREANVLDLVHDLPDLELWLELGVSVKTALSLMELGLSRTSAVELFESMTNTEMSPQEALEWLRGRDLQTFDLPEIMKEEIRRILERHSPIENA